MNNYRDSSILSSEYITFEFDSDEVKCLPRVQSEHDDGDSGYQQKRPFTTKAVTSDMDRVADFDNVDPPSPADAQVKYGEPKDPSSVGRLDILEQENTFGTRHEVVFLVKHAALRGKFLFIFDEDGAEWNATAEKFEYKSAVPYAVIPLERCVIETPPGGRRVFREHALLAQGYEFVIRHTGPVVKLQDRESEVLNAEDTTRIPVYMVVSTLIQRDAWCAALTSRSNLRGKTMLNFMKVPTLKGEDDNEDSSPAKGSPRINKRMMFSRRKGALAGRTNLFTAESQEEENARNKTMLNVVETFGTISPEQYMLEFFSKTDKNSDVREKESELIQFQNILKDGLRSAVLEQYQYFVDASREISVMGCEIENLKAQVDDQTELISTMKGINFTGMSDDVLDDDQSDFQSQEYEEDDQIDLDIASISSSENSESSISDRRINPKESSRRILENENKIDIPDWLFEAPEECHAFINECRYTNATEVVLKVKEEVSKILYKSKEVKGMKLEKVQEKELQQVSEDINKHINLIRDRLVERLRRMNEALRQERKRERADPLSEHAPLLSPVCLMDDDLSLLLLVKLKKYNDAALAYGTRRSLLLEEILNERYISTQTSVDIELSVMQLCRNYFCSVAEAIQEFIDLLDREDGEMGQTNVHDGAMSQIVLWCDLEIDKFTEMFGGPHILGRLALVSTKTSGALSSSNYLSKTVYDQRNQLKAAEEIGNYAAAATLRRKIAVAEEDAKKQLLRQQERLSKVEDGSDSRVAMSPEKDHQVAVKVAAKCIGYAFRFASESLNSIGLPLIPRLAASFRKHLKGSEAEIAVQLKHEWNHIVFDWFS